MIRQNKFVALEELAAICLHNEENIKYEQLSIKLNQQQSLSKRSLSASYQIFSKAIENIAFYLKSLGNYELKQDRKGNYWEISYKTFEALNRICPKDMKVLYAANCGIFHQDSVHLHVDFHSPLINPMLIGNITEHIRPQ